MTRKSNNRWMRKINERKMVKALYQLDTMAAAYVKEVGITPSQAALIIEELPADEAQKTGHRIKYSFQHNEPKINNQTAHPHVKQLMQFASLLTQAHKQNDQTIIKEGLDSLVKFMAIYESEATDGNNAKGE